MKSWNRICVALLMLCLVALCCFAFSTEVSAAEAGSCGDDLTWTLNDSGTLTISGAGVMTDYENPRDTPWDSLRSSIKCIIIHDNVTSIGKYAFEQCTSLTSVIIGDSVTSIGDFAFMACIELAYVTIPNSVIRIGDCAFAYCQKLVSIAIPEYVTDIGDSAFYYCSSLTGIYVDADNYCYSSDPIGVLFNKTKTKLIQAPAGISNNYDIPTGVTDIGKSAFDNCVNLKEVTIPNSVISIGDLAFNYCIGLTGFYVDADNPCYTSDHAGVLFNKTMTELILAPGGMSGSYIVTDSVTNIGNYAFAHCTGLTCVTIGNGVTSIGDYAFRGCDSLTSVMIPSNVVSINNYAFYSCAGLTSVTIGDGVTTIGYCAFCHCASLTEVKIGNGVTTIGNSAFSNCTKLTGIIMPNSVTVIGEGAFASCPSLAEVTIPDGVTNIGKYTFQGCTGLSVVTIGDGVTTIANYAFLNCTKLTEIIMPNSVTVIGKGAFLGCANLSSVSYCGTENQWNSISIASSNTPLLSADRYYHNYIDGVCASCKNAMSGYVVLTTDMNLTGLALTEDLYIDLNSYDLSGTIVTNGHKIYGIDSTTDGYTCENMGYFTCVDENGNAIVPETHFKSEITGFVMRYMTIGTESGYTFHRFYLGISNVSLVPSVTGFGYKAEFYGDDMVQNQIASLGYNLWLTNGHVVNRTINVFKNTLTLRLENFDARNYGETPVNASVAITLNDGTVIESAVESRTLRQTVELVNSNYTSYSAEQLSVLATMIKNNDTMQTWAVGNLSKEATL